MTDGDPIAVAKDSTRRPRRGRRALYGALGAGVVAAVLIGVLATRSPSPPVTASSALFGQKAPPVSGTVIGANTHVSLAELRGRYVVLAFFASWCTPCTDEVPQLESFLFTHRKANDVAVLGVDIDDSTANGAAFLRRTGATWPALEDSSGLIAEQYGVSGPPQAFLIDPKGIVVGRVLSGVTVAVLDGLITRSAGSGTQ